jgi:predicted DNA-binding protein (UPF0251 family)
MSDSDLWAPGGSEDAPSGRVQSGTQGARAARGGTPKKRENRGRYRQRALKRPGTSSTSPKQIEMAKRRALALDLRVQSYSYEEIAEHLGVTKSTIERDIQRALKELVIEPAHAVFTLEMRRIDALISTFMPDALNGDSNAAAVVHRFMVHRSNLLGWGTKEHIARISIIDKPGGGSPQEMSVEFVLPSGERFSALDALPAPGRNHDHHADHHTHHDTRHAPAAASPTRIMPRDDDVVIERADKLPSAFRKRGSWMD